LEQRYDTPFEAVFAAIGRLTAEPPSLDRRTGFRAQTQE
jgi:hypothetical protein